MNTTGLLNMIAGRLARARELLDAMQTRPQSEWALAAVSALTHIRLAEALLGELRREVGEE